MSKFEECMSLYEKNMKSKLGIKRPDMELLRNVAKACGPSLYKKDASTISSGDKEELARVKKNFISKKLGVTDEVKQDKAIANAIEKIGRSNRNKYRAIFYYFLTKELNLSSVFKGPNLTSINSGMIAFGENLIKSQHDIDGDIKQIVDNNFLQIL